MSNYSEFLDHGNQLVSAIERLLETSSCQNSCSPDDMDCDTSFARKVVADYREFRENL